jgi:hypothetical protein
VIAYGRRDRSPPLTRLLPWVLVWLLLVLLCAALFVRQASAADFASRVRTAPGTVTAREPNNHATVRAVYEVDGTRYEVADSFIGPPNPDFSAVRPGDQITVYYDSAVPSRAVLSEPTARASSDIVFAVLATILLPTLFVAAAALTTPLWGRVLRVRG